jgi:hypothetical protein
MIKSENIKKYSNVQPIWRFCFLYIITFGFYAIPWGHKHWSLIKEKKQSNINPWLYSFLLNLTIYWFAKEIFSLAKHKGYEENISPALLTGLVWLFGVFAFYSIFGLFKIFPLITVLQAVNFYWAEEEPDLQTRNFWSNGEKIWIIVGLIMWVIKLFM